MKYSFIHYPPALQMLHHDALEDLWRNTGVPDPFRIHHDYRAAFTYAKTGRLASLHSVGPKKQPFTLEQRREQSVKRPSTSVRRAITARADYDVARIRFHGSW